LADLLPALKNADETEAARVELLRRIDGAVGEIFATLPAHAPALAPVQMPSPRERDAVLAVLDTYRRTSPEMVIFGQVISNAMNSAS
jgi:riboflavin biosynthesis pyrimidine reductase